MRCESSSNIYWIDIRGRNLGIQEFRSNIVCRHILRIHQMFSPIFFTIFFSRIFLSLSSWKRKQIFIGPKKIFSQFACWKRNSRKKIGIRDSRLVKLSDEPLITYLHKWGLEIYQSGFEFEFRKLLVPLFKVRV